MEHIRSIIKEYHALRTTRTVSHWYTNVYENIQHDLAMMNYLEKQVESLETALASYIVSPPPSFLQEWLTYGIDYLRRSMYDDHLCADIRLNWPLFFEGPETFDIYEISYEKTQKTIAILRKNSHIHECNDPAILAIHENKECDCYYMCTYCEKMERAWKKKVMQTYAHPMNIFLYKEHQETFLKKWLAAYPTYSSFVWPPKKIYYEGYLPRNSSNDNHNQYIHITDFADMCAYVKETRKKYKKGGHTPIQCYEELCDDLKRLFHVLRVTDSDITLFMALWNHIDIVPLWIQYEKRRCQDILKML